ncbi:uncharacterized protein LOC114758574 [Neltuma alba]|uniref:uncharacterized protein LOC114758574 n=1 Tax=Neltuma alba TaxID=207710 RepID=UPI0010A57488|nr:uncharacterized protein LOC114758574 [Prosopis alba]
MYVTRPLSLYLNDEAALSLPPPEGPNSGYLVISDESEIRLGNRRIKRLPFFQNRDFKVHDTYEYESPRRVVFIPVMNRPLSDNCYYVMLTDMWNKGNAATSSKEDDIVSCCGGGCIRDVLPHPSNPFNLYQQFEIIIHQQPYVRFHAKSVATDGIPPRFLRREWKPYIDIDTYRRPLPEALGLNSSLRAQLPHFNFSSSDNHSKPVVVGKWYCPFIFVRERVNRPTFYEMTLEQKWVRVYSKENDNSALEKRVHVEVDVETEVAKIAGKKDAFRDERDDAAYSGFVWFISSDDHRREERIGLSMAITDRMKWEQERFGWVSGKNGIEKLVRVEEFKGNGSWRKFSCYLLVETFVLKRKGKSIAITFDFNHTNQVRCKWE